jgi:hypothetical protein
MATRSQVEKTEKLNEKKVVEQVLKRKASLRIREQASPSAASPSTSFAQTTEKHLTVSPNTNKRKRFFTDDMSSEAKRRAE